MTERECGRVTAVEAIRFLPSPSSWPLQRLQLSFLMSVNDVIHQRSALSRTSAALDFAL